MRIADGNVLKPRELRRLRVFFFDGHSGPLNDMFASLRSLGLEAENMDAMVMAQAEQKRSFVDLFGGRFASGGGIMERCQGRLLGKRTAVAMHHWLRGKAPPSARHIRVHGLPECTLLNNCERKRCRDVRVPLHACVRPHACV